MTIKLQMVLSACGTSILTNHVKDNEDRKLIIQYSNKKTLGEIPPSNAKEISNIVSCAKKNILAANINSASRISAELNTIINLYKWEITGHKDHHILLCTDTWLGETTAGLIAEWLKKQGMTTQVLRKSGLQTEDIDDFQSALSELVQWCEETITAYKQKGYRIVFNLTGGFKCVQGFLQTLALFYADETVYIFERSKHLMRIPRLPIKMDAETIIKENLLAFRRLSIGLPVPETEITSIPETLLLKVGSDIGLSAWGDLVWEQSKNALYKRRFYPAPSSKIRYTPAFEKSTAALAKDRNILLNTRMDQLSQYLESATKCNLKAMDFRQLTSNPSPPSTHEINAWSDNDAKRVFGHYERDVFVLDCLAKGLH